MICASLSALFALAGQSPPQTQKEGPPQGSGTALAVRVTTRLVQISVIAQDSRNQPVYGLKKEDFQLFDEGRAQTIAQFTVMTSDGRAAGAAALSPSSFSNRIEATTNSPTSATVIRVDELNTDIADSSYARRETVILLRQIQPHDRVALYLLRARLQVLHEFTSDSALLLKALDLHRSAPSTVLEATTPQTSNSGNPDLDNWLNRMNQRLSDAYLAARVSHTLLALDSIARHLARIPGRKNLIWISSSFPVTLGGDQGRPGKLHPDGETFAAELELARRALSDANVAVYPVDARGLVGAFGTDPSQNKLIPDAQGLPPADAFGFRRIAESHMTMNAIAVRTGGLAFYNNNDIQGSVRKALDDAKVNYVIGFYPVHQEWDGSFRSITLKSVRPGIRLRHRAGYVASPDAPISEEMRRHAIRNAAIAPLDAGEIGLLTSIRPVSAAGIDTVVCDLQISVRDLGLVHENDRWKGSLDSLFLNRASDGTPITNWTYRMGLHLTPETYRSSLRAGVRVTKQVTIPPESVELRIVVRDLASGAIGSLSIPVQKVLRSASTPPAKP